MSVRKVVRYFAPIYSPIYERFVRSRLPKRMSLLNGVVTESVRYLDRQTYWPQHKEPNINALCTVIQANDTIVEIGSGYGVCTIWAARLASEGQVISYEASSEMVDTVKTAIEYNSDIHQTNFGEQISLEHALVGDDVDVWGDMEEAQVIPPSNLPKCDVLTLDCEGAELDILRKLQIRPRDIITEVHMSKGVSVEEVVDVLESHGYTPSESEWGGDDEVQVVVATLD